MSNIQITQEAKNKVLQFLEGNKNSFLRIEITGQSASEYLYRFYLDDQRRDSDVVITTEPFVTLIQAKDQSNLENSTVDWVDQVNGAGFKINNPNKPKNNLDSPLAQKIQKVLDDEINTAVSAHGGNIELLDVIENRAYVKMGGGCQGCSSASATLRQGVEAKIKSMFPEITEVIDTTDHASGTNPYYSNHAGHSH